MFAVCDKKCLGLKNVWHRLEQGFPTFFVPGTGIFIKKIPGTSCQFEYLNFKMHCLDSGHITVQNSNI